MTGGVLVLETLLEEGVDTVFGYPGGAVIPLYDAYYDYQDKIRHILTADEAGAAFAADGYARSTRRPGVVFATSGPGATNTVTPLATAYSDSVPMVVITGQVGRGLLGKDSFQEVDISSIVAPVTKASYLVREPEDLYPTLKRAFHQATTGRKGPVLVDVPTDLFRMEIEKREVSFPKGKTPEVKVEDVIEMAGLLSQAEHPVIYAGGGILSSGTTEELTELMKKGIPVVTTLMSRGAVPDTDPYSLGHVGMHGFASSNYAINNCDLLVALGTRFSDRVACNALTFAPKATILQVDISPSEIGKNKDANKSVEGDLRDVMPLLVKYTEARDRSSWLQEIKAKDTPTNPRAKELLEEVKRALGDPIVVTDVGQHQMWTSQFFKFEKPYRFLSSSGLGTMGYGLGAAIGAKVGNPHKTVVLITGDGSFKMNLNELATVKKYDLKLLVVVMNNGTLGMVRQWQEIFQNKRYSQTLNTDDVSFSKLAESFYLQGRKAEDIPSFVRALEEFKAGNTAMVIDASVPTEENVTPMIPAGGSYEEMIL